jgi:hypothetical protein
MGMSRGHMSIIVRYGYSTIVYSILLLFRNMIYISTKETANVVHADKRIRLLKGLFLVKLIYIKLRITKEGSKSP